MPHGSYVLPLRATGPPATELTEYLRGLSRRVEVVVVDGSRSAAFDAAHRQWAPFAVHIAPDADVRFRNGKVNGVLTGLRRATHERLVVADDDVRYGAADLARVFELLDDADLVGPQNYFDPRPWHAQWDTARSLVNRAFSVDFPGTFAMRRSALGPEGYNGDVLFENLEMVRTVRARGGRVVMPLDVYVRRLPPTTAHFVGQRVRQAYDEFARPHRLALALAYAPSLILAVHYRRWTLVAAALGLVSALAECGRRRAGGRSYFPVLSSLLAPAWAIERSISSWLACGVRLGGGCRYAGARLSVAAHATRHLKRAAGTPLRGGAPRVLLAYPANRPNVPLAPDRPGGP
jgi:hypothetical protein